LLDIIGSIITHQSELLHIKVFCALFNKDLPRFTSVSYNDFTIFITFMFLLF